MFPLQTPHGRCVHTDFPRHINAFGGPLCLAKCLLSAWASGGTSAPLICRSSLKFLKNNNPNRRNTMQITFDPHNPEECATIARLLGTTAQPDTAQPETAPAQTAQPDTAPAQPDTAPAAQPDTATEQPDTAPAQTAEPETAQPETDCHGMTHDDTIHSTPASKNADGSWRAKRGQKEAYEAAIAAATGKDAPAPAPQGMPMPVAASAAPATPPAPIDYKTMAERFMAKMADPDGLPAEYEAIYTALNRSAIVL